MMRSWPGPLFLFAAIVLIAALVAPVAAVVAAMPPGEAARTFARVGGERCAFRSSLRPARRSSRRFSACPRDTASRACPARVRAAAIFLLALPLAFPPVASGLMLIYALGTNSPLGAWLAAHGLTVPDSLLGVGVAEFFVSGSFVAIAATAAFGSARSDLCRCGADLGCERMADLRARRPPGRRGKHRGRESPSRGCARSASTARRASSHSIRPRCRSRFTSRSPPRAFAKRSRFATASSRSRRSCWPRRGFCGAASYSRAPCDSSEELLFSRAAVRRRARISIRRFARSAR